MKRELKGSPLTTPPSTTTAIARPIPMKRELKEQLTYLGRNGTGYRKAHPDEKGTESDPFAGSGTTCMASQGPSR